MLKKPYYNLLIFWQKLVIFPGYLILTQRAGLIVM